MRRKSRSQGKKKAAMDDGPSYRRGLPFSRTARPRHAGEAKTLEIAPESDDFGE
jgi:hypothetical protein